MSELSARLRRQRERAEPGQALQEEAGEDGSQSRVTENAVGIEKHGHSEIGSTRLDEFDGRGAHHPKLSRERLDSLDSLDDEAEGSGEGHSGSTSGEEGEGAKGMREDARGACLASRDKQGQPEQEKEELQGLPRGYNSKQRHASIIALEDAFSELLKLSADANGELITPEALDVPVQRPRMRMPRRLSQISWEITGDNGSSGIRGRSSSRSSRSSSRDSSSSDINSSSIGRRERSQGSLNRDMNRAREEYATEEEDGEDPGDREDHSPLGGGQEAWGRGRMNGRAEGSGVTPGISQKVSGGRSVAPGTEQRQENDEEGEDKRMSSGNLRGSVGGLSDPSSSWLRSASGTTSIGESKAPFSARRGHRRRRRGDEDSGSLDAATAVGRRMAWCKYARSKKRAWVVPNVGYRKGGMVVTIRGLGLDRGCGSFSGPLAAASASFTPASAPSPSSSARSPSSFISSSCTTATASAATTPTAPAEEEEEEEEEKEEGGAGAAIKQVTVHGVPALIKSQERVDGLIELVVELGACDCRRAVGAVGNVTITNRRNETVVLKHGFACITSPLLVEGEGIGRVVTGSLLTDHGLPHCKASRGYSISMAVDDTGEVFIKRWHMLEFRLDIAEGSLRLRETSAVAIAPAVQVGGRDWGMPAVNDQEEGSGDEDEGEESDDDDEDEDEDEEDFHESSQGAEDVRRLRKGLRKAQRQQREEEEEGKDEVQLRREGWVKVLSFERGAMVHLEDPFRCGKKGCFTLIAGNGRHITVQLDLAKRRSREWFVALMKVQALHYKESLRVPPRCFVPVELDTGEVLS